jgi:hypothetical protein
MTDDYLRSAVRELVYLRFGLDPCKVVEAPPHMPGPLGKQFQALTPENRITVEEFVRSLYLAQHATKGTNAQG